MERSSQGQRVTFSGCLFMGLTVMAIGLTLLSVMSRPDSDDELFGDCVLGVIIVAPLWALVTFLYWRGRLNSTWRPLMLASLAYLLCGCSLVALHITKHRSRNGMRHGKPTACIGHTRTG